MEAIAKQIIASESTLCKLRRWLKRNYKLTIEEFVILYKIYEVDVMSGKELRDTLSYEMLWDSSKIDVVIRKVYKKECIMKARSSADERQVSYYLNDKQSMYMRTLIEQMERDFAL